MEKKRKFTIHDIDKKQVFKTPDSYFEELPSIITNRINHTGVKTNIFSASWLKYSVSLASICLLLLAAYWWFFSPQIVNSTQMIAEVSNKEIIEYLQQAEVSTYDLMEAASSANVSMQDNWLDETTIDTELLMDEADNAALEDFI